MFNWYAFPNLIGIIGVGLVLLAYFMLQANRLSSRSKTFSLLNLTGGSMILFSLFFEWNTPSVVIEVVWILISLYGTVKAFRH